MTNFENQAARQEEAAMSNLRNGNINMIKARNHRLRSILLQLKMHFLKGETDSINEILSAYDPSGNTLGNTLFSDAAIQAVRKEIEEEFLGE